MLKVNGLLQAQKAFCSRSMTQWGGFTKKHPEFVSRYRRIKARRGHKKAIIAICRMLLTAIWHILSDLKPYTPDGYFEPYPVKEPKVLTTAQALNLLRQRGYIISDVVPALN